MPNEKKVKRGRGRPAGSGSSVNPNHTIFDTQLERIKEIAELTGQTPSQIHRLVVGLGLAELANPKVLAELIKQTKD